MPPPSIYLFIHAPRPADKRMYAGAYDPHEKALYLSAGYGHADGMEAAGGRPQMGVTPGVTILETSRQILWANDSISLDQPALTEDQMAAIQCSLEGFFLNRKIVRKSLIGSLSEE